MRGFQSLPPKPSVRMTCFVSISNLLPTNKYNIIKINYNKNEVEQKDLQDTSLNFLLLDATDMQFF